MIDKLDVRIPADVQFSAEFAYLYAETSGDPHCWHPSEHYTRTADLREFGYEAILHLGLKHRKVGDKGHSHKLELIDTGQGTFSGWLAEIGRIFDVPDASKQTRGTSWQMRGVEKLELMRIDLAADVPDVPVDWFRTHMRVLWKRRLAELGEYMVITQGEGETLYFGKRPNFFRVYNKSAELREQYAKFARRVSPDAETPTFEEIYHRSPDTVMTRVERQFGGGRLPVGIRTIGQLRALSEFDPFSNVEILPLTSMPAPGVKADYILKLAGERFQEIVRAKGLQRAQQVVRIESPHNASRTLKRLMPFVSLDDGQQGVTREHLRELYRETASKQLIA